MWAGGGNESDEGREECALEAAAVVVLLSAAAVVLVDEAALVLFEAEAAVVVLSVRWCGGRAKGAAASSKEMRWGR